MSSFKISDDLVPSSLRSTYLNLSPTIGQEGPVALKDLDLRQLDLQESFGIGDLTASSIFELAELLADDDELHQNYLIRKMGLDPSLQDEVSSAM